MSEFRLRVSLLVAAAALSSVSLAAPIELRSVAFDPDFQSLSIPRPLQGSPSSRLYLVQFGEGLPGDASARVRARGGVVLDYFPQGTLLVRGDEGALRAVPGATFVGLFHPALKLDAALGTRPWFRPERQAEARRGLLRVFVSLTADADDALVPTWLRGTGATLLSYDQVGWERLAVMRGTRAQIEALARLPIVQFIEDGPDGHSRNTTVRWIIQSNVTNLTPFYSVGVNGAGQVVGILDDNLRTTHSSFADSVAIGPGHRKIVYFNGSGGAILHGTHVSGTAAGDAGVFDDRRGVAWGAKIAFATDPGTLGDLGEAQFFSRLVANYNAGARVHTNSWGDDGTRAYTPWARAIDAFSHQFEDAAVTLAISNGTIVTTPENAKSVLAVGATMDAPNQESNPTWFSGSGPTLDGRRKPEVTGPGENILSSNSGNLTGVTPLSGTSMATPGVAGAMVLARQYFVEGRHGDGNLNPSLSLNPSGALLRATLVNAAQDMTGVPGYGGGREGFGRILLDNALSRPGETRKIVLRDVLNAQGLSQGQSATFRFLATSTTGPLIVTLAFTDPPAAAGASNPVVNNLDLRVVDPAGAIYRGNVFSGGQSITGGAADAINSVEQVLRTSTLTGIYEVQVTASSVPIGTQGYAVVVSGPVEHGRISGQLSLGPFVGTLPATAPIQFLNPAGSTFATGTATINSSARTFIANVPANVAPPFRVALRFGTWLRRIHPPLGQPALMDTFVSPLAITLPNGNVDGDSEIGPGDFSAVLAAFGNEAGSPGYVASADLNQDGEVGPADFSIVLSSFGLEGD